jgi:phosphoribosylanthranilate isomerase
MIVKICGVCSPRDAALVREAGADVVGVILDAPGPRRRTDAQARRIYAAAAGLLRAGVFQDAAVGAVVARASALSLDIVQLHGDESAAAVTAVRAAGPWAVWKAIRVRDADAVREACVRWADRVDGVLVDAYSPGAAGGTGLRFDWEAVAARRPALPPGVAFIVAGGLRATNVARAIAVLGPDVVDVSSGVERAPGEKAPAEVGAFVAAARSAPPARGGRAPGPVVPLRRREAV